MSSSSNPVDALFLSTETKLLTITGDNHRIKYIHGYTKHLYDPDYMTVLNKNLLSVMDGWEEKVNDTLKSLEEDSFWVNACIEDIRVFFDLNGTYQKMKRSIDDYEGCIALQAVHRSAFLSVLNVTNYHVGELFYQFSSSSNTSLHFKPDMRNRTFVLTTQFSSGVKWTFRSNRTSSN